MTSLVDTALRLTYSGFGWRRVLRPRPIPGVRAYRLTGPARLVVTIGTRDELVDDCWGPCAEAERLRWLAGHGVPCPEIVDTGVMDGGQYLVARLPDGVPAVASWPRQQRLAVVDAVADLARDLHALDAGDCPFDRSLKVTIPRAKQATVFAEVGGDAIAKLTTLIARALATGKEEPAVCHGDLRPANVLIDPDTLRVTAVADVARLGIADRYTDLVAAGHGWPHAAQTRRYWYRYGEIPADADRVNLYRLLAEFCLHRPRARRVEPRQYAGDRRRRRLVRQRRGGVPRHPPVLDQGRCLVVQQT
ncbi:MAG: phosphotransferase, partial [Stackebrandtia sp.]